VTAVPGAPVPPATAPEPGQAAAPEAWSDAVPPGGYVCAVPKPSHPDGICGMPVESEPCNLHGPTYTRDDVWGGQLAALRAENERLLADVAEARTRLADVQRGAGEWVREAVARETAGLTAQLAAVTGERDRYAGELDEARAERDRYRKWLEAIAECRAGMPYPDAARQALGGDHA
jgi:hypothetical protein